MLYARGPQHSPGNYTKPIVFLHSFAKPKEFPLTEYIKVILGD